MSSSPVEQFSLDFTAPPPRIRLPRGPTPPRRTAPYDYEPGFFAAASLWLYGNARLLDAQLAYLPIAAGQPYHRPAVLEQIELEAEEIVLSSKVLVCAVHNSPHQRAAVVPLRWGAPRIVVVSGGFYHHLGRDLQDELFPAARLWRYNFDPKTDLVISRRAPDKKPTFALHNATVDRLVELIATRQWPGTRSPEELLCRAFPRER
jgi:hypothetical protein